MIWLIVALFFVLGCAITWVNQRHEGRGTRVRRSTFEPVAILFDPQWHKDLKFPVEGMVNNIIFWHAPCVDTTYFALSILSKYAESAGSGIQSFLRANQDGILDFLRRHFDSDDAGFRHAVGYRATTYGNICAINAVKRLQGQDIHTQQLGCQDFDNALGMRSANVLIDFTWRCFDEETGGFRPFPGGQVTSVYTDVAVSTLWSLGVDIPERIVRKIRGFLLDKCFKRLPENLQAGGFSTTPRDAAPCSSATRYGLRVLDRMQVFPKDIGESIFRFWQLCERTGGFSIGPLEPPDLHHTDMSICGLRDLEQLLGTSLIFNVVRPEEVVSFIDGYKRMRSTTFGKVVTGFAFRPDSEPNLYSTRAAVSILRLFDKLGVEIAKARMPEIKKKVEEFTLSCYAESVGGFAGYSVR